MRIAVAIIGALIVLALLWGAGELHYQGCVDAATARTESRVAVDVSEFQRHFPALRRLPAIYKQRELEKAINGCSRLPF
jgi:hypothetical protein